MICKLCKINNEQFHLIAFLLVGRFKGKLHGKTFHLALSSALIYGMEMETQRCGYFSFSFSSLDLCCDINWPDDERKNEIKVWEIAVDWLMSVCFNCFLRCCFNRLISSWIRIIEINCDYISLKIPHQKSLKLLNKSFRSRISFQLFNRLMFTRLFNFHNVQSFVQRRFFDRCVMIHE